MDGDFGLERATRWWNGSCDGLKFVVPDDEVEVVSGGDSIGGMVVGRYWLPVGEGGGCEWIWGK